MLDWGYYVVLNILASIWLFSEFGAWAMVRVPYVRTIAVGYFLCFCSAVFHHVTGLLDLKWGLAQFIITIFLIHLLGQYMLNYEIP